MSQQGATVVLMNTRDHPAKESNKDELVIVANKRPYALQRSSSSCID